MTEAYDWPDGLSRREFLRASVFGLMALGVPIPWSGTRFEPSNGLLGRVTEPTLDIFKGASFGADKVETFWRDDVLEIAGALLGDRIPEHNQIWYEIEGAGFAHSSGVQPVLDQPNAPLPEIEFGGQLMEVTVPFVDAYWRPRTDAKKAYRYYYGTTHWVTGVSRDVRLRKWYRIQDDKWDYRFYAPAEAFRAVPAAEVAPISPGVPLSEKRIEVDLTHQLIRCFEDSQMVFSTRVSSGRKFGDSLYYTPEGSFVTFRKRGSRHMAAGNLATGYDLPGVPWVSYITDSGIAFHGTYWHNDYGIPRSHGCLNMSSQAAKWLYRWTQPVVPAEEQEVWVGYGTEVIIRT